MPYRLQTLTFSSSPPLNANGENIHRRQNFKRNMEPSRPKRRRARLTGACRRCLSCPTC